ncbi:ATP-binding protein [Dactylosporangium sp. CA-139066]|uniref:ATP-binding protein n=1 Tax=Dactylosporangium sp. CA-139066 TaxID=3239930 RepID=UPI003D9100ED
MLIKLCGLITIEESDRPTRSLSSAQAQVAFARLTLERVNGTSRDQLADTVWPDGPPDTWASALRSVVSRVRAFAAGAEDGGSAGLVSQGGRYLLRLPDDVVVDVERAEADVHGAAQAFAGGGYAEAQRRAAAAIECLRGQFLPEHEGEWVAGVRERLDGLLVQALETASLAGSALGDARTALYCAEEAVRLAPLRESAHRCRMAAHVAGGNRAEALRSYNHLRQALADELGVDPAPETQAAYLELLSGPEPRPAARSGGSPAAARGPAVPFVGRGAELEAIEDAWSRAERGESALVLVAGPAGVGKTRLVTVAARQISLDGGVVLYGRCDRDSPVLFQPVAAALTDLLADVPAELAAAARRVLDRLAPPAEGPGRRAELLAALGDVLAGLAAQRPVLLITDDLDAAGDDTLLLLRHLLRYRRDSRLLVLGTFDPGADCAGAVAAALRDLEHDDRRVRRLALGGLDEDAALALVRRLAPDRSAARLPAPHRLMADTAGNPYLMLELLRWHRDRDGDKLPPAIHDYVSARLARLDPAPMQLLRTAAVAGRSFELELVAEAAELDAGRSMDSLDVLMGLGMIVEAHARTGDGGRAGRYRFAYDLLRRSVYERLNDARRRWLHTRLADAIETHRAGQLGRYSRILAHHRAAGATPHGDQRAVRWSWRAAARATAEGAATDAVRLHRLALEHVPPGDEEVRAEALTNLGLAQLAAGEAGCEETLLDGALRAMHHGRFTVAAQAALGLADAVQLRPALRGEAEALIGTLVRRVVHRWDGPASGAEFAPALDERGDGDWAGRRDRSRPLAAVDDATIGRLLARQARLGAPVARGPAASAGLDALGRQLRALESPEEVRRRLALSGDVLALAGVVGDHRWQLLAAHHRAMAAQTLGDLPVRGEALQSLASAGEAGGAQDERLADMLLTEHAVAVALTQGRLSDAMLTATLVARAAGPVYGPLPLGISPTPGVLAGRQLFAAQWLVLPPEGRSMRVLALDSPARPPAFDPYGEVAYGQYGPLGALGEADGGGDDPVEEALAALARGERGAAALRLRSLATGVEPLAAGDMFLHQAGVLAMAVHELGDANTAEATRALLLPYADLYCGVGYRSFAGPVAFHLGRLSVTLGDWPAAERYLTAALSQLGEFRARPWIALAQQSLAEALQGRARAGDNRWAAALRAEASRVLTSLGTPRAALA